jgi:hypothetical protein
MTGPTTPFDEATDIDMVDAIREVDLRRAPDLVTRDVINILTDTNALVSTDASKAVFMSGGRLSRVSSEVIKGQTHYAIKHLSKYGLKGRLAELAHWVDGNNHTTPSIEIIGDVIERADELCVNLPVLEQIITYPTFSPSGVLQDTPGYSRDTRCWFVPTVGLEISEVASEPSYLDVKNAVDLIDEILCDFPFVTQADKANIVALMLQPFVRRMIPGPTPIHAIDAPKAGTGKTLLAELALLPSFGLDLASSTQSNAEEEWKKQLTTLMLGGTPYWFCDNLATELSSGHLASTITKAVYEERILGGNNMCRRPVQHTWVVTGNNITYSDELIRRVVPTYLNAHSETPQMGRKFRHEDVKAWAADHRGRLLWACLVLVQNWIAQGKPRETVNKKLGMFDAWSEIMGNILHLAGIEGFLSNLKEFYDEVTTEQHDNVPFITAWWETHGSTPVVAKDLVDFAHAHLDLVKQVPGFEGTMKPTAKKVAGYLKQKKKNVYAGLEIIIVPGTSGKADKYRLIKVTDILAQK